MTKSTENKCLAGSHSVGSTVRPRRVSVALALSSLAILGIALTTGLAGPFGFQQTEVAKSTSAPPQSMVSTGSYHNTRLSTYSPPQASIPTASPDGDLKVIRDFVLDGLEFAVAGAEVSNQFGPYRQIGNTVSWLAQELSQPEDTRLAASKQPNDASLVAYPLPSATEREIASWLLQNSPWTR